MRHSYLQYSYEYFWVNVYKCVKENGHVWNHYTTTESTITRKKGYLSYENMILWWSANFLQGDMSERWYLYRLNEISWEMYIKIYMLNMCRYI